MLKRYLVFIFCFLVVYISKAQEIQRLEYFFNADPGFGAGSPLTFSVGEKVESDFTVPLTGLETGMHEVFVRALDTEGNWSHTASQIFSSILFRLAM